MIVRVLHQSGRDAPKGLDRPLVNGYLGIHVDEVDQLVCGVNFDDLGQLRAAGSTTGMRLPAEAFGRFRGERMMFMRQRVAALIERTASSLFVGQLALRAPTQDLSQGSRTPTMGESRIGRVAVSNRGGVDGTRVRRGLRGDQRLPR